MAQEHACLRLPSTNDVDAMNLLHALRILAMCLCSTMVTFAAGQDSSPDPWQSVQRLLGEWAGTTNGQAGSGSVLRRYAQVMGQRYIHETNTSTYPPQERNKAGEVHEHWGMVSFDKARKVLMLRQFHIEGFVNTYRQVSDPGAELLVFESEAFENFSNSWKARETYTFLGEDEFVETFELAPPGKPYQIYGPPSSSAFDADATAERRGLGAVVQCTTLRHARLNPWPSSRPSSKPTCRSPTSTMATTPSTR